MVTATVVIPLPLTFFARWTVTGSAVVLFFFTGPNTAENGKFLFLSSGGVAHGRTPWHTVNIMQNRSNNARDVNQIAADVVRMSTSEVTPEPGKPEKNPAAVALGKLGGLKGGKARAKKLSAAKRHEIAKKAARKRWGYTG